jgi:hypothetical protein
MRFGFSSAIIAVCMVAWNSTLTAQHSDNIVQSLPNLTVAHDDITFINSEQIYIDKIGGDSVTNDVGYVPSGSTYNASVIHGWNVDLGFYVLKPYWSNNQAASMVTYQGSYSSYKNIDFDYEADVSPFIGLSFINESGLGTRIRFWDYSQDSSVEISTGPNQEAQFAAPGGIFSPSVNSNQTAKATSDISIQTWDFDVTQQMSSGNWSWYYGGGIRYLRTSQSFNSTIFAAPASLDDMVSSHGFEGVGPTLLLSGQRDSRRSNFSLYGNGRISVLIGENDQFAQQVSANGNFGSNSNISNSYIMTVAELELGTNYTRAFQRCNVVGTAGFVAQYWPGIGNAANNEPFISFGYQDTQNDVSLTLIGLRASLTICF